MTRMNRLILLAVTAFLVMAITAPAMATEESTGDATTETTVAPEVIFEGEGPAVVVPPAEEAEVEQPWTARFIYPVIVLVTVLLIIGLAIGYNRSIRTRYRVVS
ncbi:MAG: hypothetical protein M3132_03680 [Actinomycetia bacterium]|nr:hypothetical protein [Actinomycetes bacterium]